MDAFHHYIHGRLLIIRWFDPTAAAIERFRSLIAETHEQGGGPLFYSCIVPPEGRIPNADERKQLAELFDAMDPCLLTVRLLILGRSLRQSLIRSVLTAVVLMFRDKGAKVTTDPSAAQMAEAAHALLGVDAKTLLDELITSGVLRADEL